MANEIEPGDGSGTGDTPPVHVIQVASRQEVLHVGPLPPAAELKRYDEALPGSAHRIVTMAEKEQDIRIELARADIANAKAGHARMARGQWMAITIAVLGLGCALILGLNGKENAAIGVSGATLASMVIAFIVGRIARPRAAHDGSA
jgi:uncharacterized membrane protein